MIFNITQNTVISQKEVVCNNFFSQSLGLMFRRRQNLVMIFPRERKISLHTFFVFYPLDILILDDDKKIIDIKHNLQPWKFWNFSRKGKYVIEIAFPSADYKIRDELKIESKSEKL